MRPIYDYPQIVDRYVGDRKLGCVMLNTDSPLSMPYDTAKEYFGDWEYTSEVHDYVDGIIKPGSHHLTVRYGFLPEVKQEDVEAVLETLDSVMTLWVSDIHIFPGISGEPYECVNAKIKCLPDAFESVDKLTKAHQQLGVLPNLATFPDFIPHVTIGYFKKGFWEKHHDVFSFKNFMYSKGWKISVEKPQ